MKDNPKDNESRNSRHTANQHVIFKSRRSPFYELFQANENIRGITLMVVVIILYYLLNFIVRDSLRAGRIYWNISVYIRGWGSLRDIAIGILLECAILTAGFLFYPLFKIWLHLSRRFGALVHVLFALSYAGVITGSFIVVVWAKVTFKLPTLVGMVLAIEQLRLCMKSYSFVRENVYKVLYPWHKDDSSGPAVWYAGQMSPSVGSFSQYCYFLFCPTLLYRDHYPRNTGPINWFSMIIHLACFFLPLLVVMPFYDKFLFPETLRWTDLFHSLMICLPTGLMTAILGCVCIMHGWMNIGGELTRFADREFYLDWWNSTIYTEFYRKWNVIPHHFIHEYLYRDMKKIIRSKIVVMFIPLLASSVVHEYILGMGIGHLFPSTTVLFAGVGVTVVFVWPPKRLKTMRQLILLGSLGAGLSMMIVGTIIELKARELCPREESLIDLFLPRIIECYQIYN